MTSRAVIRKGAILCLESFTEAGQRFSFYDENGKPLNEATGLNVWVSGKPTELRGQFRNQFDIEYGEKVQYANIVASVGNYAEHY